MEKVCEICNQVFETSSVSRIYCQECSGQSTRASNETRKH